MSGRMRDRSAIPGLTCTGSRTRLTRSAFRRGWLALALRFSASVACCTLPEMNVVVLLNHNRVRETYPWRSSGFYFENSWWCLPLRLHCLDPTCREGLGGDETSTTMVPRGHHWKGVGGLKVLKPTAYMPWRSDQILMQTPVDRAQTGRLALTMIHATTTNNCPGWEPTL